MPDTCPFLSLQPIRDEAASRQSGKQEVSARALQYDMDQIAQWTRRLCAYLDARLAAIEERLTALETP